MIKQEVEHKAEILKDPDNICECIIALYSFSISKEKMHQVPSQILSKLAKKDIESLQSGAVKARSINARGHIYLK